MSTDRPEERPLREAIAMRARDLGAVVRADDLRLEYAEVPEAPSYHLVRATWGGAGSEDGLAGLLHEDREPDLMPGHAVATLLAEWRGTAAGAAAAVAFLLDPMARWEPLLTAGDTSGWRSGEGPVDPPALESGPTRLVFWWCRDTTAQQVVVDLDASGSVTVGGVRTAVQDEQGGRS